MNYAIETQDLTKQYAQGFAVKHVSLRVPKACVYGFIGPNGAGKSTTMKMLLGLTHPTGGSVTLLGQELTQKNRLELLANTGSMIENPASYGHLTARENLQITAQLRGTSEKEIERVLELVHLTDQRTRKVKQFSLGMRQRLGIAQALLGSPKLLILDEPTNGLDPEGIREMRELLCSLPKQSGTTVLISSHLLGELEMMVEHVGVIDAGRLLYQGKLEDFIKRSRGDTALRVLDTEKAQAALAAQGLYVRRDGEWLLLPAMEDKMLSPLVAALCDGGAGVVGVMQRTRTLEETFLHLTHEADAQGEEDDACNA